MKIPEENADLNKRIKDFSSDLGDLVKKHNIDVAAFPVYVADGKGGFTTVIQQSCINVKAPLIPTDFMEKDDKE